MVDEVENIVEDESNEEAIYFCYSASLRIFGDIGDVNAISKELGVEPAHVHKKGESESKRYFKPYEFDMWLYRSPVPEDRPLDVHIQKLWDIIKPHKDYLKSLKKSLTVDIFCGYRSNSCTAGFEVSPSSLEMFIDLDIPFGVSVIVV